ncbi:hypothetical protein JCM33374_g1938 [Metschnikowia sp. JCM 33374]|nr:hypothetical protein JCM33374_g1938 [Metschnikowia sp. JCM 33374]
MTEKSTATAAAHPKKWLIAYNSISSSLWSIVFFNTVFLGSLLGQPHLFQKTNLVLTVIQCFAVVEIVNSVTGVVKSPVFTTVSQVLSRLLIVLGIMQLLPDSPANYHWVYATLSLSWSITEIVRYSYYAANLKDPATVPYWLTWARYSLFYVLYPTGVASEVSMIYMSLDAAKTTVGAWYSWLLFAILFTYPPGLYTLYTYMIKQRKKVLGSGKASSQKKTQ